MAFKRILNAAQNRSNTLSVLASESPCCGDSFSKVCQYSSAPGNFTSQTVTGFTYKNDKGVNVNKLFPVAVLASNRTLLLSAFSEALLDLGYLSDQDSLTSVSVSGLISALVFEFYSELEIVALLGAITPTITKKCNSFTLCVHTRSGIGSSTLNIISLNSIQTAIIDVVAGTTTNAQIKTSVEAAVTAAGLLSTTVVVTSTGTAGATLHTIAITAPQGTSVYWGTVFLEGVSCAFVWSA